MQTKRPIEPIHAFANDYLHENEAKLAALAWRGFDVFGRGCVTVAISPHDGGTMDYLPLTCMSGRGMDLHRLTCRAYDPELQFVAAFSMNMAGGKNRRVLIVTVQPFHSPATCFELVGAAMLEELRDPFIDDGHEPDTEIDF